MKRVLAVLLVLVAAAGTMAGDVVNSRWVPDTTDLTAVMPKAYMLNQWKLLRDLANILPSDTGGDGITVDSIRGNPDIDSLGGSILVDTLVGQRAGGVIVNDSLKVNGAISCDTITGNIVSTGSIAADSVGIGGIFITKIDTIGSDDTLMVILSSGDSLMIAKTR